MDVEEDEKPQLLLDDFCLYDKHGHLGESPGSFHFILFYHIMYCSLISLLPILL